MLLALGYRPAVDEMERFHFSRLKPDTRVKLIRQQKHSELCERRWHEAGLRRFYCIPTPEEAEAEIGDSDYNQRAIHNRVAAAFLRYVKTVPLFLVGESGVTPVSHRIAEGRLYPSSQQSSVGRIQWEYLEASHLTVSIEERLRTIEAAKLILGGDSAGLLNTHSRMGLSRLVARESSFKSLIGFEGQYLAIRDEDSPSVQRIRKLLGVASKEDEEFLSPRVATHSPQPHLAATAYRTAFPNGKDSAGATWAEVERKTGYARRTILRALRDEAGR